MEITNNINTTNPIGAYEHIVLLIWLVYDDDRLRVGPIPTICRPTICGERSTMHPDTTLYQRMGGTHYQCFFVVTMDEIGAMVQKVSGSRGLMKTTK
jgi:hypothetical protein